MSAKKMDHSFNQEQAARLARRAELLNAIAGETSQSSDLPTVLNHSLQRALLFMGMNRGGILLLEKRTGLLKLVAHSGLSHSLVSEIDCSKMDEGFFEQAARTGEALVIQDIALDPRMSRLAAIQAEFRAIAVAPIHSKGEILGTLFGITVGERTFLPQEVELLASIGNQIGITIENARLMIDTQNRLAQLTALQETSRAVVSTLNLNALLDLIVQQAAGLLWAEGGILNLANPDHFEDEVVACTGTAKRTLGIKDPLDQTLSGWVTLHNQPVIVNDVSSDPRVYQNVRIDYFEKKPTNAAVAPLIVKDRVIGTLALVDKMGGTVDFEQSDLNMLVIFASQAAAAIENARLYAAEQRRSEQFQVIAEIGRRLTLILDLEELLKQVVTLIQETFGYYHVAIGLIEGDEVVYQYGAGEMWQRPGFHLAPSRLKIGSEGLSGWVAAHGTLLNVADVSKDPRYVAIEGSQCGSELVVPIIVKEEVIGTLDVLSNRISAFDETDLIVMQTLAHQVGAAIENARLFRAEKRRAEQEERSRLARELHDAVTQTLFSASLIAEAVPTVWDKDQQRGRELLQELRSLSRGALAEMRTLLLELRPAALVETRLEDLLSQLGEAASGREGIPIKVLVEGKGMLPPEVHIALYRIAQEALNNMVKHARASQATVRLCYTCGEPADGRLGKSVLLSIIDNGRGFDPALTTHDRLGLEIMQERADTIGATLFIDSRPGEGTQVSVMWEQAEARRDL
jgi:GAF domain-containing protein